MTNYINKGLKFENEIERSLKTYFPFYYKIPDTRSMRKTVRDVAAARDIPYHLVFGREAPGDFQAVKNGESYLFECKMTTKHRFEFNRLKPNQEKALIDHEEAYGHSYLLLNFRSKDLRMKESYNKTYIISIVHYLAIKSLFKASVPRTFLEQSDMVNEIQQNKIGGELLWEFIKI